MKTFRHGGYVAGYKEATSQSIIRDIPIPEEVIIPVRQYAGEPCDPCVSVGEEVTPGQVISRGLRFPAVCHASVAGTVVAITRCTEIGVGSVPAVHIKVQGDQGFNPLPCRVPLAMSPEEILEAVVQAGIQEDDSLGHPLYRRLMTAQTHRVSTLIINGMESEPYLTAQNRSLRERSALLIFGARAALRLTGAEQGVLALPGNEGELVQRYEELLADETVLRVVTLRNKYPQGDHNQLISSITGREVAFGELASTAGALVLEVSTLVALGEALVSGKPMIDCVITVSGPAAESPGNYRVPVGTPIAHILKHCGIATGGERDVVWGGPMRGTVIDDLSIPISKSCQGIVALPRQQTAHETGSFGECVNCARCVEQCPQRLYPNRLSIAAQSMAIKRMERYHVAACTECGLCNHVCPANRPITQMIRAGKVALTSSEGGES
ncbi:MAG TPA: RnfABCDGE type electron transport complex subunit C [Bacillota bacterium]|nr:RnfABCDGE type electron transport complex subunit C [Bacillota bacterium]